MAKDGEVVEEVGSYTYWDDVGMEQDNYNEKAGNYIGEACDKMVGVQEDDHDQNKEVLGGIVYYWERQMVM